MLTKKNSPRRESFWRRLVSPSVALNDPNERRFATVLATLLLALMSLYFLPEGIRAIVEKHSQEEIIYFSFGVILLSLAYIFSRSPYPRWGARITILYFSLLPFLALIAYPERYQGENISKALIWSLPALVMGLILLHPNQIKWAVLFNIGLYLLIPALWTEIIHAQVFPTLWLVISIGGLLIVSAYVQNSYIRQVEEKTAQNKFNEIRYREIFLGSPVALFEADFSAIKNRLDQLSNEYGEDLMSYVLAHPEVMEGAASSVVLLDANQAALELYESPDRELLKTSIHQTSGDGGLFSLRDGVINLWHGIVNNPIEMVQQTLRGNKKYVIIRFATGIGYEKTWERIIISAVDITPRKKAEASMQQLASAVEASASSIVITDLDGKIEYVNPAFTQITGYSLAEARGENPRILKSDLHPNEFYEEMWQTLLKGENWQGELANKKKNGEIYWELATISPVKNSAGEVENYVAVKDDISLAKQAEAEIRRQSEFLQTVIDGIDSPFYVLNVDDYSIALANKTAQRQGNAKSKTCYALTHKMDVPCSGDDHPCPLKHVLKHKEPFTVEHVHYRADGSPYYVEVHGYPVYDENGEISQMIEYSIDITVRKNIERELRKLSNAAEQTASGIVITNIDSIIEFANPAAVRITGYGIDELIGKTPNILKSGKHEPAFYDNLWKTIQRGDTWRGELINRRKDGSFYWESQVISSVKDIAGNVTHYVAVKEDITEKKESAEQLRNLSNATEQTVNGVVIADRHGRIEYINPAFTNITGYTLEEVRSKTLNFQRSNEHPQSFYEELDSAIARGDIWKGEIINLRKGGSPYWEAQVISPIHNEKGEITHYVYVKEDISRRKQLEQALALAHEEALVASDMKTQLLANVSHDMRTPLGAILGYTEMLQTGVFAALNSEQEEAVRAISASGQRLLDFVNNLLSQAQIDTGKVVLNISPFRPEKLIISMGGEISLARTKGLIVETKVDENLPDFVQGDAYWLGQVLHNLISNAIKFTPSAGLIAIELLRSGEEHWALRVADNGKGIPLEAQAYIFESFRQVDGSPSREAHTGSGLGLSIVKHLVDLMGGEIKVNSKLGEGSIFTVTLPITKNKEKTT